MTFDYTRTPLLMNRLAYFVLLALNEVADNRRLYASSSATLSPTVYSSSCKFIDFYLLYGCNIAECRNRQLANQSLYKMRRTDSCIAHLPTRYIRERRINIHFRET